MADILSAALSYAESGFQVLPCRPKSKVPLTAHGLKDATTDPDIIKRWWHDEPNANVAIRCGIISSGLVVIDVDGDEGRASLSGKKLPPTVIAKTGGGGWHYLYFSNKRLRPKVGLLPKVDLRAEDSYIVAPPSVHPSGALYEWAVDPKSETRAELPEWVYDLVDRPESAPPAPVRTGTPDPSKIGRSALQFIATGAPKGQQRLIAVAAARNLLTAGYSVDAVGHKLWSGFRACEQDAEQPWSFEDAAKIAKNVADSPAPPMREMKQPSSSAYPNGRKPVINIISAAELMKKDFPPLKFLIPRVWPEGMSLFGGKPKVGKSFCALGIAVAIAFGGMALGRARVEKGEVLYLALEDGERRVQNRLKAILLDQPTPEGLHFAHSWLRVNDGGIEALAQWMQAHPQTRLIVVDTLRKIRPRERVGGSIYNADYDAIAPLSDLSHEYNISIWGITHLRKAPGVDDDMDEFSGSTGLTGAADHLYSLKRERGKAQAILRIRSRDIGDEELALEFQPPHWVLVGTAKEARQSAERKEIADIIRQVGRALTPKEIADAIGKNKSTVNNLLWRMNEDGILISDGKGRYELFPRAKGAGIVESVESIEGVEGMEGVENSGSAENRANRTIVQSYTCHALALSTLSTENTKNAENPPGDEKALPEGASVGDSLLNIGSRDEEPRDRIHVMPAMLSTLSTDAQNIVESRAVDSDVCFCGKPVYAYSATGDPLCAQHTEEEARQS